MPRCLENPGWRRRPSFYICLHESEKDESKMGLPEEGKAAEIFCFRLHLFAKKNGSRMLIPEPFCLKYAFFFCIEKISKRIFLLMERSRGNM